MGFPEIEDIILLICSYLEPEDVAQLGATCRLLNESCRLDRTWLKFFERSFGCSPRRTNVDHRLSVFQLFARKRQRRLFKRGGPTIQELTFQIGTSSTIQAPVVVSNSISPSAPLHGEHRTRSRGGSTDLSILIPAPQQQAAAAASEAGVGAVRFVLVTRHKIAIAATDQGHVFGAFLQPSPHISYSHHGTSSSITTKRVVSPANVQTDAFAHSIGAKARRDAKRKYAGRGSSQESSLVYFKINASRQGKQSLSSGNSTGLGVINHGLSGDDIIDDSLDFWDRLPPSPHQSQSQNSARTMSLKIKQAPPLVFEDSLEDSSDGGSEKCVPSLSRGDLVSSQSVDSQDGSVKGVDDQNPLVDELIAWESGLKDPQHSKKDVYKWKSSSNRSRQGSINVEEEENLSDSNITKFSNTGRSSGGKGAYGNDRPRGKDLWSAADRLKLDEKQNKKNKKAAEKQAALEAEATSKLATLAQSQQSQLLVASNLPITISTSASVIPSIIPSLSNRNNVSPSAFSSKKAQKVSTDGSPSGSPFASSFSLQDNPNSYIQDGDVPTADFLASALLQGVSASTSTTEQGISGRKNSFQKQGSVSPSASSPAGSPSLRASKDRKNTVLFPSLADELSLGVPPFRIETESLLMEKTTSIEKVLIRKPSLSIAVARMEGSLVRDFVLDSGIGHSNDGEESEDASDGGGKPTSLKRKLEKKLKAKEKRAERIEREAARVQARNGSRFAVMRTASQGTAPMSTPPSPSANSPLSSGSNSPSNHVSSSPIPFSLAAGSSAISRPPSPPNTPPAHSSSSSSTSSVRPRGSQLRSDMWIACQWVRHETPIMRRWIKSAAQGNNSSHGLQSSSSTDTNLSTVAPPRPIGSGESITYHNVVAFADGTLGVLAPSSISKHPHDTVLVGSTSGHIDGGGSKIAPQGPQVAVAQHLIQQSKSSKNAGVVSKWLQRGVTWLERPPGEERERVAAVCVCKGRHFDFESGQQSISMTGDVELISDIENDMIFAAFGRVVGCWLYGTPHGKGFDSNDLSADKRQAPKYEPREGAVSPSVSSPTVSSSTSISVTDRKTKYGRKGKQSIDCDTLEGNTGIMDGTTVELLPTGFLNVSTSSAIPSSSSTTSNSIPAILDADRTLEPFGILRVHSHLVTSLSCWRKRLSATPFAAQIYYGGDQVCIPTPRYPSLVAVVSGDAGGDIVLWHVAEPGSISSDAATSPLSKVAVMQLRGGGGGGGGREGVTCLSMDGDFIIAGGSEGTVTIWRRRFGKVSTHFSESSSSSSSSSSNTTLVELAPELLSREHRAHSIVRLVVTPSGRSLVSAALSGGGEGDVRLWMIPPAPGSISSSVRTGTKVANVVSNAISTAAIESKIKWAEARGYTSPSPTSISLAPAPAPLSFLGNPNPQPTPITVQCKVLRGHTSRITGLSMDNCVLISLSLDGAMKVWDLQEPHIGGMLFTARLPDAREASSLSCSGTDVAIGSVDGHVFVFSFGSLKQIQQVSSVTKEVATAPVTTSLDKVQMGALTSHDRNRDIRALNADAEGGWTRLDLGGGDINGDLTPYELQQLYDAL